jgi:hypothetical protein
MVSGQDTSSGVKSDEPHEAVRYLIARLYAVEERAKALSLVAEQNIGVAPAGDWCGWMASSTFCRRVRPAQRCVTL